MNRHNKKERLSNHKRNECHISDFTTVFCPFPKYLSDSFLIESLDRIKASVLRSAS
ncbi:MAG: hypothetical protein HC767_04300 [Akkermansiaceae bacterium]|nr:hypothetical protein [Akkermansiaceae bacterium]